MAIQVVGVDREPALQQLALLQLLASAGQQGVDNFREAEALERADLGRQALAQLLGGTPGQGPKALAPGATGEQGQLASLLSGTSQLGAPQGPPTAPTPRIMPGMSQQEAQRYVAAGFGPAMAQIGLERRFPKPGEPFTLNPGDVRYDASGNPIASAPAAPDLSSAAKEARDLGIDLATPEGRAAYEQYRQNLTRPPAAPVVNLPPQERESQTLAAHFVDKLETEQLPAVRRQINQIDQIERLLDAGLETGRLAELKASLSNFFGVELDPNSSGLEAARSLINGMIVNKIGEATFGALSEGERSFLAGITADTSITPEANRRRLSVARKMLRYEQAVQREASRYADEKGTTAGLGGHLDAWAADHPLVTEADLRRPAAQPAGADSGVADGTIATNPQTGQSLIRRAGKWVPL